MFEDQDITADAASHHSSRSTVVWVSLAIMTIAFSLLLSPIPPAGDNHARIVYSSATLTSDSDELSQFIPQEPDQIDHSILIDTDLMPAAKAAPMAIAAYD
jgi:hypothetical protein